MKKYTNKLIERHIIPDTSKDTSHFKYKLKTKKLQIINPAIFPKLEFYANVYNLELWFSAI
jgi:hypothetical protein